MITGKLRAQVDALWTRFWTGGITNPLTVIEQISYLAFARMLDLQETTNERKAERLESYSYTRIFPPDKQHLRWSKFRHIESGDKLLALVRDELFPFLREDLGGEHSTLAQYLQDAQCLIPNGALMVQAVNAIDQLPLQDRDTKGDLYEHLLSKLTTAGINGQFRTPRHIIRAMVQMVDPKPDETVCDPACGTAGFLIAVMEYLQRQWSSPELIHDAEDENGEPVKDSRGNPVKIYPGDQLEPYREHIQNDLLSGFDFDTTMLRVGAMNMMLHGIDNPSINYQDSLAESFTERYRKQAADAFNVILANPPFKGNIDAENVAASLKNQVKTKKTELLFIVLFLRLLHTGGRAAVIVPDGVLFGSSKAHRAVRKMLVDDHQLDGIVSLPSGVFKPYAGVSTAILLFTKDGETNHVWYYDLEADGFSLDDKRQEIDDNDIPDLLDQWHKRDPREDLPRTGKCFWVPADEIRDNKYDLAINRYKEIPYEAPDVDPPDIIFDRLRTLETEIMADIDELEGMLK